MCGTQCFLLFLGTWISLRFRPSLGVLLAPFSDTFGTKMSAKGGKRRPRGARRGGLFFISFFEPHDRGGPPPLKTHRHHLRCPATSALGGSFRRKMEGKQMQKARAYHLESRIQGKLELELRLTVSLTYKGGLYIILGSILGTIFE